jgi:DNA ligase-1
MLLGHLVKLVAQVRATAKKTEKIDLLAHFLKQTRGKETELAAHYLSGNLPQGRIGIGWARLKAAMIDAPPSGAPLTLLEVDQVLNQFASTGGSGSFDRKVKTLRSLFERATFDERPFLSHLLVGELRQGALGGLLMEAIAKASGLSLSEIRNAMMFSGNIGEIARVAMEEGMTGLARFTLKLLSPIAPMLANSAEDVEEVFDRLGQAAFEYKLDGARIQVHKGDDEVRIFTRQLQDVTERLPEVVEWTRTLPVREIVLEGEAIALRPDGKPLPFQVTMRRFGRVKEVESIRQEIPLTSSFFDCLYLYGAGPLVSIPYEKRFEMLSKTISARSIIPRIVTDRLHEAQGFFKLSVENGHEGLMAKSLTAPYVAGQRGYHWLKLKTVKTVDLVILAAEWGSGRRSGWLSNLHLGARDPQSGEFVMLGKTFKGLTDEMLKWQTEKLLSLEVNRDQWTVFVRPELVAEIAFGDVQESSRYPAGLALRFARVKRYRPDKSASEADTLQTVMGLFEKQRM